MTDEEINKAIAEACGWKLLANNRWTKPCGIYADLPNYAADLNAMHEAEKVLTAGSWKEVIHATNRYTNELCKVLGCLDTALFQFAHATSAQRAEAFLRTLNLWVE